jgi:hypothetical protein
MMPLNPQRKEGIDKFKAPHCENQSSEGSGISEKYPRVDGMMLGRASRETGTSKWPEAQR